MLRCPSKVSNRIKFGRNDLCPCQSGEKFKKCCAGKVDWQTVVDKNLDYRPYLSVRGRNLYFVSRISEALQLDPGGKPIALNDYKARFRAEAVRKIHEGLMNAWPPDMDIIQALRGLSTDISGLYIGNYSPEDIERAVVRHSIYANKIVLVDPFIYPASVRDEYNPILNPEEHRTQTLKNVNLWFGLLPWIQAGIIAFIRLPFDFDSRLNWELLTAQHDKIENNPELKEALEECLENRDTAAEKQFAYEQLVLGAPDSYLRKKLLEQGIVKDNNEAEETLKFVHKERARNPNFLEPVGPGLPAQLWMMTTGASYLGAKLTADITGSYLFTDISFKWKEIELDRKSHSAENKVWAPFAKALQNTRFKYLDHLRLDHALSLRTEQRLESFRGFLGKVWKAAKVENDFDSANAVLLAEELNHEVQQAEQEWDKIDTDLLKMVGTAATADILAAGPLIASGHAYFLAAAIAASGAVPLIASTRLRQSFPDRFPAAFFMKIDRAKSS